MLHRRLHRLVPRSLIVATAAALALAAPAVAKTTTYPVSGKQTVVDEQAGTYKMSGGLIGDWSFTSFTELAKTPLYRAKGTEHFSGCLDRGRDGSCANDPTGTLDFGFRYWAQFGPDDALVWGACWHPVTAGTGAFKGAAGVLMMADTPTGDGKVTTDYIGSITLKKGSSRSSRSRASAAAVGGSSCGAG
jgi:hypothetical protein